MALRQNALADLLKEADEQEKNKSKEKVKEKEKDEYNTCVFGFVPHDGWAKRCPGPVFSALSGMNEDYLQTVADKRTWMSRATFFGEFCAAVKGTT